MKMTAKRFSDIVEDLTTKTGFNSYVFRESEYQAFKQFLIENDELEFLDLMQTEEVNGIEHFQTTEAEAVMIRVFL